MIKYTPDNIQELEDNQIFVFGSNLNGYHSGGSARLAYDKFGAIWGKGEGLQGQSYAFPTLDKGMYKLDYLMLKVYKDRLYEVCEENHNKQFLLTKVGCGIAGFSEEYIKSIFENPPKNLLLPKDWVG